MARFDADSNEVEGVIRPRGYPALKLFPKGNKEGIDYSGEKTEEALKVWLRENSESCHKHIPEPIPV